MTDDADTALEEERNPLREDRERILRMLAEGKISAEEAANLLDAIAPQPLRPRQGIAPEPSRLMTPPPLAADKRFLLIEVSEDGETKVNLRIPLALARAAGKFIPRSAQDHLKEYSINLPELVEDLGQALDVGPLIDIRDGDDRVLIAVG
jgi:hypothetical protein